MRPWRSLRVDCFFWEATYFSFSQISTGAAMKVVQELLGHATIEMTMRYAHLSPDVPRHAVKLLDGLGSSAAPAPNAGRQVGDKGRFGT